MAKKIISFLLVTVIMAFSFSACSENDSASETANVLKIGNTEYTLDEFNYMYVNMFNDLYNNLYSYYGSYLVNYLDLSKSLSEQDMGDGTTWHDYISESTLDNVKVMTALYETAIEEGFELSESDASVLESLEEKFESAAAEYNVTVSEFIEDMYGKGITYETVYKMTEMNLIAAAYANAKEQEIVVTDEEMRERYESDKNSFDTVSFRFGSAYYSEIEDYTDEDIADCREIAEAFAAAKSEEEFKALAIEYASDDQKEAYEDDSMTLYSGATYTGVGIDELAEWLFSEERVYGDTYIYEDENYGGFIVAFFIERNGIDYELMNVRHILIMPEENEDGSISDEAWTAAESKAKEILDEFLAGEATEESFSEMAVTYSEDPGSASNGGLYSNIYKGQMVAPFENWCFDESRTPGDTDIIETSFGYHIMYFSSVGDNYLVSTMYDIVLDEKFNEWVDSLVKDISVEKYEEFSNVGGVVEDVVAAAEKYRDAQTSASSSEESSTDTSSSEGEESSESGTE